MNQALKQLLDFFHLCERLKIEHRHGKTSSNEPDTVAAHSWRLAMILMFLAEFFTEKIDLLKAVKIALVHDLAEAITGDQAYFKHMFNEEAKLSKQQREDKAIDEIVSMLPQANKNELSNLWEEYEAQNTYEAKLVKAIDKIEAQIQHNEADISVWNEYDKKYYQSYLNSFCDFDKVLKTLRQIVQDESKQKLSE